MLELLKAIVSAERHPSRQAIGLREVLDKPMLRKECERAAIAELLHIQEEGGAEAEADAELSAFSSWQMPYFCLTLVEQAAEINPKQVSAHGFHHNGSAHTLHRVQQCQRHADCVVLVGLVCAQCNANGQGSPPVPCCCKILNTLPKRKK